VERRSVTTIISSLVLLIATTVWAQAPATPEIGLMVKSLSGQSTHLVASDLAKLPRVHLNAVAHDGKSHDYEGVRLSDVLAKAGAPTGNQLRGKEMADIVVAEAADNYRVVFSIAELDPDFGDRQVIVADKMDGQPLPPQDGPLRLVVAGDKRQARWVRMLTNLTITRAP
jgi:DMSO/TMAO reductase YedYZ molybdopterin-dependent catalytic subunit